MGIPNSRPIRQGVESRSGREASPGLLAPTLVPMPLTMRAALDKAKGCVNQLTIVDVEAEATDAIKQKVEVVTTLISSVFASLEGRSSLNKEIKAQLGTYTNTEKRRLMVQLKASLSARLRLWSRWSNPKPDRWLLAR